MVDEHGTAVILKNNVSRYIVIDFGKEIMIILSCIELIGSYVKGMARVESDIDIVVDSGLRGAFILQLSHGSFVKHPQCHMLNKKAANRFAWENLDNAIRPEYYEITYNTLVL